MRLTQASRTNLPPELAQRRREFRVLLSYVVVSFCLVAATFFTLGYLIGSLPSAPVHQPVKVIT